MEKLAKVRDQMGEELEDLTASLFEVIMFMNYSEPNESESLFSQTDDKIL